MPGAAVIVAWVGMVVASMLYHPAKTTIVLADNQKDHNAIVVMTDAGSVVVDKPGEYVKLIDKDKKPTPAKIMPKSEIEKKFSNVIKSLPPKPVHIYLYFKRGSNELVEESKKKLPLIYKIIAQRSPCAVDIIGHTDTKGTQEENLRLSLKRAEAIKRLILSQKPDLKNITVESYGEHDLVVPTKDEVSEPKNRCVEIFIR